MDKSKFAVFIDVENLTQWVKDDGTERLMSDLATSGQIIVRRAYGVWSKPHLVNFQAPLNRLGFELVHSFHPVSGKNSADIQLTVDVMDALRLPDVETFVLATGDSDFSPLFRRLREMGKEVIGIGPKSPLSESVKTSCSRYLYTDSPAPQACEFGFGDAADLVEHILSTRNEPIPLTQLKQAMANVDSAFDERSIGFSSFSEFLKAVETVDVFREHDSATIWFAQLNSVKSADSEGLITATKEQYQSLLRHKKWRSVSKELLVDVDSALQQLLAMGKPELIEALLQHLSSKRPSITASDIRKALAIFIKARLFKVPDQPEADNLWAYMANPDYLKSIDQAIISRIRVGCEERGVEFNSDVLQTVIYERYKAKTLTQMIDQAYMPNKAA